MDKEKRGIILSILIFSIVLSFFLILNFATAETPFSEVSGTSWQGLNCDYYTGNPKCCCAGGGLDVVRDFYFPKFANDSYWFDYNQTVRVDNTYRWWGYYDVNVSFTPLRTGQYWIFIPKGEAPSGYFVNYSIDGNYTNYVNASQGTGNFLMPVTDINSPVNLTAGQTYKIRAITTQYWQHSIYWTTILLVKNVIDNTPPKILAVRYKQNHFLHNETPEVYIDLEDLDTEVTIVQGTIEGQTVNLTKVSGTNYNGTWKASFDYYVPKLFNFTLNFSDFRSNKNNTDTYAFTIQNNSPVITSGYMQSLLWKNTTDTLVFGGSIQVSDGRIISKTNISIGNSSIKYNYSDYTSSLGSKQGWLNLKNINTTKIPLLLGYPYSIIIQAEDNYGNIGIKEISFKVLKTATKTKSEQVIHNSSNMYDFLDSSNTLSDILLKTKTNNSNSLSVAYYNESIFGLTEYATFKRFYSIELTNTSDLNWAIIKLYYTDQEVSDAGLTESLMRLARYNETSGNWEKCVSPQGGVDTTNNFLFCNTSAFSEWSIIQLPQEQPIYGGGSSGSSSSGSFVSVVQNTIGYNISETKYVFRENITKIEELKDDIEFFKTRGDYYFDLSLNKTIELTDELNKNQKQTSLIILLFVVVVLLAVSTSIAYAPKLVKYFNKSEQK